MGDKHLGQPSVIGLLIAIRGVTRWPLVGKDDDDRRRCLKGPVTSHQSTLLTESLTNADCSTTAPV